VDTDRLCGTFVCIYVSLYPSLHQSTSLSLRYLTYVERADLHIQGELGQIHAAGGRDRQPLRVGDSTVRSDPYEAVGNSHLTQTRPIVPSRPIKSERMRTTKEYLKTGGYWTF
jgi:hypothetical protein